ncbi:MAG: ABC transporter permease [archaeon]
MRTSIYLATKNITTHKKLFFLVVIILIFSFINLTFFTSLNNGIEKVTNEKLRDYSFGDLRIMPDEDDEFIKNTPEILKKLERIPEVKIASERIIVTGTASDGTNSFFANILGVNINKELHRDSHHKVVARGDYISNGRPNHILLGQEVVGRLDDKPTTIEFPPLDIGVGEELEMVYQNNVKKNYTVGGIYTADFWIPDFDLVLPIKETRDQFNLPETLSSEIILDIEEGTNKEELVKEIKNSGIDLEIEDSVKELAIADNILEATRVSTFLATLMGAFTTFIVVFILIYININHNKKQLGILKATGIKGEDIVKSYVILSFAYAITGIILGMIALLGIIFYLTNNPIYLPVGYVYPIVTHTEIILGTVIIVFSSVAGGIFASYKILRENIVDILRGNK